MQAEQFNKFTKEVHRIGYELIEKAITSEQNNMAYWETVSSDLNGYSLSTSESLYSGVSGIALFLLELYKYSGEKQFLNIAVKAANWLEYRHITTAKDDISDNYSFFTGKTGVSFFFLKLYEQTNDIKYQQLAIDIASNSDVILKREYPVFDLLNGTSGVILGLLHVYSMTGDSTILEKMLSLVNDLISKCRVCSRGVYWDRSGQDIQSLCGFSHGASGISYVLEELSYYFDKICLKEISKLAQKYERSHYSSYEVNWPDFRKGFYDEKSTSAFQKAYEELDYSFFVEPAFPNAWCHGAVGITFSRHRSLELFGDDIETYNDYINGLRSLNGTLQSHDNSLLSFTLCHDLGAVADLYLQCYKTSGNNTYYLNAIDIVNRAIDSRNDCGVYYSGYDNKSLEDQSLFLGNAGVGYTILRVLNPSGVFSVLQPNIINDLTQPINTDNSVVDIDKTCSMYEILRYSYPRTLLVADLTSSENHSDGIRHEDFVKSSLIDVLDVLVNEWGNNLSIHNRKLLNDIYGLEKMRKSVDESISSYALLSYEQTQVFARNEKLCKLGIDKFENISITINPRLVFYACSYSWKNIEDINALVGQESVDEYSKNISVCLFPDPESIRELWFNQNTQNILGLFASPCKYSNAKTQFLTLYRGTQFSDHKLSVFFYTQIIELLKAGVLIDVDLWRHSSKMLM